MIDETEFKKIFFETKGIPKPLERVVEGFERRQDRALLAHAMSRTLGAVLTSKKEASGKSPSIELAVEDWCEIPYNTYKKYIGLKRAVTRLALAKFAVGLSLPPDKADELFILQGGKLNETNDFDYITIRALEDGDNLSDFQADIEKYTNVNTRREL